MSSSAEEQAPSDEILGNIPRNCILHVLTVIEAAIFKGSSSVLDDFVKELTELVMIPKGRANNQGSFRQANSAPLVPPLEVNQFYESAISSQVFTIMLEGRINEAIKQSGKKVDIDDVQMLCWKYYSSEKKKALSYPKWLSPTCTYRLFIIFNQLLSNDMTLYITEQKMNYLLERIVLSCGFLSQAILKVVKNEHRASGISFPEFLEEITDAFEFLKLEMSLTCEMILDLLDEIVRGVLKKGYLVKKGGNRKNWKKRWFILKENTLFYYESREQLIQKGGMVLNKATDVVSLPDEKGKNYRFVVTCGVKGRAFEIRASDQRTKSEWVHAIKEAISLGRLKRNDVEENSDPCELAAHYRLKYGLTNAVLTKSLSTKPHSHIAENNATIEESDSDDSSGAVANSDTPSLQVDRLSKSHEPVLQRPPHAWNSNAAYRHSSCYPSSQTRDNKFNCDQKDVQADSRNGLTSVHKTLSPSLSLPDSRYRNSITVMEGGRHSYESLGSRDTLKHQYETLESYEEEHGDSYIIPENEDVDTDEVYEEMELPDEAAPPLPPRRQNLPKGSSVDKDGYLKMFKNFDYVGAEVVYDTGPDRDTTSSDP